MSRKECCSHESTVILQQNKIVILFFVGIAVNGLMLRLKAKELSDDPAFKASHGWYEKWKRRHSVSMRTKTTGKKKAPSRNLVLRWIKEAWAEIPQEMVVKSFKTYGISNALDGTEDDVVYSEETPEVDDEDIEESEFETDSENETDGE